MLSFVSVLSTQHSALSTQHSSSYLAVYHASCVSLDLEDALGRKGWGTDRAVAIVDETLEGLLGQEPPSDLEWDVVDFVETGAGRRPLTDTERRILGRLAARFPLMG